MANITAFAAEPRDRAGKGAARAMRREGRVPGVIYGNKQTPVLISVDPIDLMKQMNTPCFFARVYEVDVSGDKHRVLARDLQLDPVSDQPIHIDFMRFSASTRLNIDVQVVFENEDENEDKIKMKTEDENVSEDKHFLLMCGTPFSIYRTLL